MSNEELLKNEKAAQMGMGFSIAAVVVVLLTGIFLLVRGGKFNAFMAVPLAFIPIVMLNVNSLRSIRREKKERNL